MPKRKVREEKPKKKISKKQILIPPVAIGAATLAGILIMQFIPPPPALSICLKAHNVETFNLHPTVELLVNGQSKLLPDDVGKQPKDGKECLRVIHTDAIGNKLHIEFIRPIRLNMGDFMNIYLEKYNPKYSYYSEENRWTQVVNASEMPPFTNDMVARLELMPK